MFEDKIKEIHTQLRSGLETAFIEANSESDINFQPQFVFNNPKENLKIIETLKHELNKCESFKFSVAFITKSGLAGLAGVLQELNNKGIKGQILTTDYLFFTEPAALKQLHSLENIELKIYKTSESDANGFHTKGYIFHDNEMLRIIVGSANLTQKALSVNREWNTKIVSTSEGAYAKQIVREFEDLWTHPAAKPYDTYIKEYTETFKLFKSLNQASKQNYTQDLWNKISTYKPPLTPNPMQTEFMGRLKDLVDEGESRALLVSATGTGKTYASAFGVQQLQPKRILFIVHREQIAKQAMTTYKNVFGTSRHMGLLSGTSHNIDPDFLFATVQTISKEDWHTQFKPDSFDVIIIDEAHHAASTTYQRLMDYFKPKLWLGMTASPERTDSFNIYELFHYNIVSEIRLQHALENNLLCPFHYYGISDFEVEATPTNVRDFNRLTHKNRIKYIMEQAAYYGYSGHRVKGLIFCSTREEASKLSELFNEAGWKTLPLSGENSQEEREHAIHRLCNDELPREQQLDYIITVDIFNEGVDIPEINQVIMLRPTESPIVFVQQLGRGLRKNKNKEYVIILDFIGNYQNNFMIPVALSGDRSYNKDNMRHYVGEGTSLIPGCSTIYFDEITKDRIYRSIDSARFNAATFLKKNYLILRNKLGRIPSLQDFKDFGGIDIFLIIMHPSYRCYHVFLQKVERSAYTTIYSDTAIEFLKIFSTKYMKGKRIYELCLLKLLLEKNKFSWAEFIDYMHTHYNDYFNLDLQLTAATKESISQVLTGQFYSGSNAEYFYAYPFIKLGNDIIQASDIFNKELSNLEFRATLKEHIEYGISEFKDKYAALLPTRPFKLYAKYSYEDVTRLLEWDKGMPPLNIGGYAYNKGTNTLPIFINYEKDDSVTESTNYNDRFISPKYIIAATKANAKDDGDTVLRLLGQLDTDVTIELFVRKSKFEGHRKDAIQKAEDEKNKKDQISEFYYLGPIKSTGISKPTRRLNKEGKLINHIEIEYMLEIPVREDIYSYLTT
ncbi:MAG: DEAD/DEAH box helicase [Veillonella caviae]|nr:DEAD/DEAH box helicase [Veillonella caviae]